MEGWQRPAYLQLYINVSYVILKWVPERKRFYRPECIKNAFYRMKPICFMPTSRLVKPTAKKSWQKARKTLYMSVSWAVGLLNCHDFSKGPRDHLCQSRRLNAEAHPQKNPTFNRRTHMIKHLLPVSISRVRKYVMTIIHITLKK